MCEQSGGGEGYEDLRNANDMKPKCHMSQVSLDLICKDVNQVDISNADGLLIDRAAPCRL